MISIDARCLSYPYWSGVEHYTYQIVEHMTNLVRSEPFCLHFDQHFDNPQVDSLLRKPTVRRQVRKGSAAFYGMLPLDLIRLRSKVYYAMGGRLQYYHPPCRTVITIHDCAPITHPNFFPPGEAAEIAQKFRRSIRHADAVVTVSEVSKTEISECLCVAPERIFVAPNAPVIHPGPAHRPEALTPGPYLLMVNPGRVNKNWRNTLLAFDRMERRDIDGAASGDAPPRLRVLLAGRLGDQEPEIHLVIREMRHGQDVILLGYVSNEELLYLYQNAHAMAFISSYEGFGIPALEAMHHGVPLVVSQIPILREVTGNAALHVPHENPEAIAQALEQVCFDNRLRKDMISRGRSEVRRYDWTRSAEITLQVLGTAANS